MIYNDGKAGFLTVIIGPMFSEKSGELIKQCLLSQNYQNKTVPGSISRSLMTGMAKMK